MSALVPGDADCTTGLSKRCYDYWIADSRNGFSSPMSEAQKDMVRAQCYAFARGVVDEITANGRAVITDTTGGLQQVGGGDTDPPATEKELALR